MTLTCRRPVELESFPIDYAGLLAWRRTRDTLSLALAVEDTVARAVLRALGRALERVCDVTVDLGGHAADHLVVEGGFAGPQSPWRGG